MNKNWTSPYFKIFIVVFLSSALSNFFLKSFLKYNLKKKLDFNWFFLRILNNDHEVYNIE